MNHTNNSESTNNFYEIKLAVKSWTNLEKGYNLLVKEKITL